MASPIINEIMMDVFSLELPKGTRLFKGTDAQALDMSRKGPVWLTLNKSQCKKYGKNVLEFVTNRKLKLINITSHIFRMHFLDQVNISIGTNDSESLKLKEAILSPIGLPNTDVQKTIINKYVPEESRPKFCGGITNNDVQYLAEFAEFIGFHRYSGTNLDLEMVSAMREIYGKHVDGYIQPTSIPTCWHTTFCDEVCLFDLGAKSFITPISKKRGGSKTNKQKGGGEDPRENEELYHVVSEKIRTHMCTDDLFGPPIKQISN